MAVARPIILQIIPRLDTGGAELSTLEIVEAIVRGGGVALVATEGGRLAPMVSERGGEVIAFPAAAKNPLRILANARALEALIRERGVALLHARSRAPAWSALIAARRARVAFVTTYHGAYAEQGPLKRLYNSVMARGDVVIANSQFTADLIHTRYRTSRERIRVIHRGVDASEFDPAAISDARIVALRERWGITPRTRVILQAARLTSWKGQGVLVDAGALLQSRGLMHGVAMVLAGDAQGRVGYESTLRERISMLGLGDCVRLVGHVDDMPAAYRIAHVTVVASIEPEAFGRVATEAQAMGSPVIATNIGAPPETVLAEPAVSRDKITGWLVAAGSSGALADRLADALALSGPERAVIGERARAHVRQRFTLEAMKRQTLEVYDRLLGTDLAAGLAEP
ncbi:MAG: glycosyltransferase family 4 protein [Bacteroidota bacterium]